MDIRDAKQYSDAVKDELDKCHALAMRKYHQYARDGDAFHSVRQIADKMGTDVPTVIRFFIAKKDVSIENMEPGEKRTSEIHDSIVYRVMLNIYEGNGEPVGLQKEMPTRQAVCG